MGCSRLAEKRLILRYELFVSSLSLSFLSVPLRVYHDDGLYRFEELGAIEPTGHNQLPLSSDLFLKEAEAFMVNWLRPLLVPGKWSKGFVEAGVSSEKLSEALWTVGKQGVVPAPRNR